MVLGQEVGIGTQGDKYPHPMVWLACGCGVFSHDSPELLKPCAEHSQTERLRVYVKATVAEAERLPSGRWLVKGHGWLAKGVEFSDEDFRENFEQI